MTVDNSSILLKNTERRGNDDIKYLLGVRCKYIKHLSLVRIRIYVLIVFKYLYASFFPTFNIIDMSSFE